MVRADFQRYKINYLYYLAHIDNIPSMCRHGLLSHNKAHGHGYVQEDIADPNVVSLRNEKVVFGRPLHDYVPLYFTPKNPMLYRRRNMQNRVAILCLDSDLLLLEDAVFSDGNAASLYTDFFNDLADLSKLDWDCIRSERWDSFLQGRRRRCAEVLVPGRIPFERVERIIVRTHGTRHELNASLSTGQQVMAEVRPRWYF